MPTPLSEYVTCAMRRSCSAGPSCVFTTPHAPQLCIRRADFCGLYGSDAAQRFVYVGCGRNSLMVPYPNSKTRRI